MNRPVLWGVKAQIRTPIYGLFLATTSWIPMRASFLLTWLTYLCFSGITSFVFTKYGQGFYLRTASEFERLTLSARYQTKAKCELELAEGMRPAPPPEPEPQPEPEVQVEPAADAQNATAG